MLNPSTVYKATKSSTLPFLFMPAVGWDCNNAVTVLRRHHTSRYHTEHLLIQKKKEPPLSLSLTRTPMRPLLREQKQNKCKGRSKCFLIYFLKLFFKIQIPMATFSLYWCSIKNYSVFFFFFWYHIIDSLHLNTQCSTIHHSKMCSSRNGDHESKHNLNFSNRSSVDILHFSRSSHRKER